MRDTRYPRFQLEEEEITNPLDIEKSTPKYEYVQYFLPAMSLLFNLTEAECFGGSFTIQSLKKVAKSNFLSFLGHPYTKWIIEKCCDLSIENLIEAF